MTAAVFRESWVTKKARIRAASPYGHLAAWDVRRPFSCAILTGGFKGLKLSFCVQCLSVIVKTGADLRQEQMAVQLIQVNLYYELIVMQVCSLTLFCVRFSIISGNKRTVDVGSGSGLSFIVESSNA